MRGYLAMKSSFNMRKILEDRKSKKPTQHKVFGSDAHKYHQELLGAAEDLDATYSKITLQA